MHIGKSNERYAPKQEIPPPLETEEAVIGWLEGLVSQLEGARAKMNAAEIEGRPPEICRGFERKLLVRHGAALACVAFAFRQRLIPSAAYEQLWGRTMQAVSAQLLGAAVVGGAKKR